MSNEPISEISTYDGFNRLVQTVVGTTKVNYDYRPDGMRASKTVNGAKTTHLWDGSNIVADIGHDNSVQGNYLRGIGLIASKDKDSAYNFYLYNAHGDVVQLIKENGEAAAEYD